MQSKDIKPSGNRDGFYKVIAKVKPVKWWEADSSVYFDLRHPMGHKDNTAFRWDELLNISPGDLIVIGGVSNYGKSCLVLNYLAENIDLHDCLVMGNEYTTLDGIPSPKFKRRLDNMSWVKWFNGSSEPKFQLLPVRADFDSYVEKGKLNIIDWINMPENPYLIGKVLEDIKASLVMAWLSSRSRKAAQTNWESAGSLPSISPTSISPSTLTAIFRVE